MTNLHHSIGIDISKATLDIFDERNKLGTCFSNTEEGAKQLLKYLHKNRNQPLWRIVLEPSGGYESSILLELTLAGYPISLVHAKRIRDLRVFN